MKRILSLLTAIWYCISRKFNVFTLNISPSAQLGKGVVIKRGSVISSLCSIGNYSELYRRVVLGPKVRVGDYTSINNGTVIECGTIGNFCSIGVDVIIGPGEHPIGYITTSTLYSRLMGGGQKVTIQSLLQLLGMTFG